MAHCSALVSNFLGKTSVLNELLALLPFVDKIKADILIHSFLPMLKAAIGYSIPLSLLAFLFGILIALKMVIIRILPYRNLFFQLICMFSRMYVSIIRGTPLLVQLFIIFYGLPSVGVQLEPFPSAVIGFSLNVGAYAQETLRAGILSVNKGQWEAGFSVGMSYLQTFYHIIAPQALRVCIPNLSNTLISLIKDSSLASLVLVTELFKQAQIITARNYEFMLVYIEAAVIYWIICLLLSSTQNILEIRLNKAFAS